MKRYIVALLAISTACAASAQMPPNSFLVRRVNSVDALVKQVRTNPVVMDRFVRHFQMSPEKVIDFLKSLHVETLKEDTSFEVFNVPPQTGELRSRRLLLKKGTMVFVTPEKTPALWGVCGNPLIRTDEAAAPVSAALAGDPMGAHELALEQPLRMESGLELQQPLPPVAPDVEFVTPPQVGEVGAEERAAAPFGLGALAFLPTVLIGLGGGGGGGVIPEPATIFGLGLGCAMLAARFRRRSR